jgi:uncharacterized protein (TIGR03435 family)
MDPTTATIPTAISKDFRMGSSFRPARCAMEMARFASMLSVRMDRPVVDLTGVKGFYDFTLKSNFPAEAEKAALSEWFSSSMFTDIQRQLGLQLETDKAPVDYLVVDHVEQPSEN